MSKASSCHPGPAPGFHAARRKQLRKKWRIKPAMTKQVLTFPLIHSNRKMKYTITYILLSGAFQWSACNGQEAEIPFPDPTPETEIAAPPGYTLVWQDEFDSARLPDGKPSLPDPRLWWYETGNNGWGNNEIQRYIPGVQSKDTCARIIDGSLEIIARKVHNEILSARLNSTESWTYGYFEARLKLPQGKGTWPAFWMMPKNLTVWPDDGEIDIMEEVGYRPNRISSSIHCKAYHHSIGTQKTAETHIADAEEKFHVYAVEWTKDFIKGYVDGECFFTFTNEHQGDKDTWPFDAPFYIKLNLAWGGQWGGAEGVDESQLPATYKIDYVRVFQKTK